MHTETFSEILEAGEQIRWAGRPVPGKFMDEENRTHNLRWMCISGVIFAAVFILYAVICAKNGSNFFSVFTLAFVLIGLVVFLDPYTTYRKLRKLEYAVTNRRIIVCTGDSHHFDLPLSMADDLEILPGEGARPSLRIGSPTAARIKPWKKRRYAVSGFRYDKDEASTIYPLLYAIEDPEEAKAVIEAGRQES